jgi:hypothetical protein
MSNLFFVIVTLLPGQKPPIISEVRLDNAGIPGCNILRKGEIRQ